MPARCRAAPNCQYNKKKRRCKPPNAWIEHLVANAGKGMTKAQLSASYRRVRNNRGLACRRARNRGSDHSIDAQKIIDNPYYLDEVANRVVDPINMQVMQNKVVQLAVKRHRHRLTRYFPARSLTAAKLQRLAKIIDKVYWNGTLLRAINKKLPRNRPLSFSVIDDPAATTAGLTHRAIRSRTDHRLNTLSISVNLKYFGRVRSARRAAGIITHNKLDALAVTVGHELMHALHNAAYGVWPSADYGRGSSNGHGYYWRMLWHNFHGGSMNSFTFTDRPAVIVVGD